MLGLNKIASVLNIGRGHQPSVPVHASVQYNPGPGAHGAARVSMHGERHQATRAPLTIPGAGKRKKYSRFGDDSDISPSMDPNVEDPGDDSVYEPNWGHGHTGHYDNSLSASSGGMDPFAVASFGFGEDWENTPDAWQLDDYTDDLPQAYRPLGPDPYDPPEQIGTRRNYRPAFGAEYFHFQGPAAVIGHERGSHKYGLKK